MATEDVTREEVARIVKHVCWGSWASRLRSLEQLNDLTPYGRLMRIGLAEAECVALVRAAGDRWPASDFDDPRQRLLLCACQSPHASCFPEILKVYPRLPDRSWTRWQALRLLSAMPQREAAEQWVRWYRVEWRAGRGSPPPLDFWPKAGLHAEVLLPALLEFADTSNMPSPDDWLAERLIEYVVMFFKSSTGRASVTDWATRETDRALAALPAVAERPFSTSRWSDPFRRYKAAQLVTLLGYAGGAKALRRLKAAVRHDDPRVACAAVGGLIRMGRVAPPAEIDRVASDPDTRRELYDMLRSLKHSRLFPRKWLTQERLAEADMVAWLIADIDAAPDAVKLLERLDADGGRYYVFAFRFSPPHSASKDGWMAGISGPWTRRSPNRVEACGGTFSRFEPADAFPPAEHLGRNLRR